MNKFLLLPILILINSVSYSKTHQPTSETLLLETYGTNDLATKPAFQGGYINFGYWKNIWPKNGDITTEQRVRASESLYDIIIEKLEITPKDKVLEIGAGRGNGCIKVITKYKPQLMTGVDITPHQTERSKNIHAKVLQEFKDSLQFLTASSDKLPFSNNSYSKIYSVEAAQCFPSMAKFAQEAYRVLQPGGRLVLTAHFSTNAAGYQELRKLIPTVDQEVDRLIPIQEVRNAFAEAGFKESHFEDIGEHVFEGLNKWISQVEDVPWGKDILNAYKNSFMSYYIIILEKI